MSPVSAILLAAGESRRMGSANKLLLPVSGVPLVRSVAEVLKASMVGELVVVLGHQATEVERALDGLVVRTVFNERFREGQMTSVHAGLEALSEEAAGIMVCLSDQPKLTVTDVDRLVRAFLDRTSGDVLVPTYRGRRGNPVVLSGSNRKSILNGRRNLGCRQLIEKNPDIVTTVEWDCDHVVADIDTPEEFSEFSLQTAETDPDPGRTVFGTPAEKPHAQ